ncbi:MAG: hypothetical protein ACJ8FT_07815 [Sphingomonas sp.]
MDLAAKPASPPATTAAARPARQPDQTELMLGGGALALLALGGAAYAMSRRRRHEEEWIDEPAMVDAPAADETIVRDETAIHHDEPAIVAPSPSAFAWGGEQPSEGHVERDPDDDRLPGESWVERAYRGPSAGNPSVSLKNRLRRAAFFDKREREVVAGTAEPVDMDAGLPEAMVDEQEQERALA